MQCYVLQCYVIHLISQEMRILLRIDGFIFKLLFLNYEFTKILSVKFLLSLPETTLIINALFFINYENITQLPKIDRKSFFFLLLKCSLLNTFYVQINKIIKFRNVFFPS